MKKLTVFIVLILGFVVNGTSEIDRLGNTLIEHPEFGFSLTVYDHRPETLRFMESNELQGGGPTWVGLITAALTIESPKTLHEIEFDDEADMVVIYSESKSALLTVQSRVKKLMSDRAFLNKCIEKSRDGGYLE